MSSSSGLGGGMCSGISFYSPHSHVLAITCPTFFHQGCHVCKMHHLALSAPLDHSPHCCYLGKHYAACVSICLCLAADMCESVLRYVSECWPQIAECYRWEHTDLLSAKRSCRVLTDCMRLSVCRSAFMPCIPLQLKDLLMCSRTNKTSLLLSCACGIPLALFYLWRQNMGPESPHWRPASNASHISPSTSCSRNTGCQLPLADVLNSWFACWRKQT